VRLFRPTATSPPHRILGLGACDITRKNLRRPGDGGGVKGATDGWRKHLPRTFSEMRIFGRPTEEKKLCTAVCGTLRTTKSTAMAQVYVVSEA